MSDDKMRSEFEAWADSQCLPLTRINWDNGTVSEYAYTATFDAWQVWQAAYQAGQKAEREAIFIEWENGETLAAEVERLRDENEWMGIAGQQMARHLAEAKAELAETKRWLDERSDAYGKACSMVDQLQNELAAAKAASVCPVEIAALGDADWEYSVGVKCKSDDDANKLFDWLWERLEERGEG